MPELVMSHVQFQCISCLIMEVPCVIPNNGSILDYIEQDIHHPIDSLDLLLHKEKETLGYCIKCHIARSLDHFIVISLVNQESRSSTLSKDSLSV